MINYLQIINKLEKDLEEIKKSKEDFLIKTEKSITLIQSNIQKIKNNFQDIKFASYADEITFFKVTKPALVAKLIYQVKLFNIESKRVDDTIASQIDYLEASIIRLQEYFKENQDVYIYFRSGDTRLDKKYFLVSNKSSRIHPDNLIAMGDDNFSTSHDTTYANFIANTMLIKYLKKEIQNLQGERTIAEQQNLYLEDSNLYWSGNKVDLVELIYALHASKVINRGNVEIKEIAAVFEYVFNIDIRGYYRTYLEIKTRKTNKTKFIDALKAKFLKRMNQSDI